MFEFKYFFLIFLIFALVVQYFRYKNTQNQTFLSHLEYFQDLSIQNNDFTQQKRFLVGFEYIKFSIFKKLKINNEDVNKNNDCNFDIESFSDIQCALYRSRKENFNARYFVKNETLFKILLKESGNRYAQRLSGGGINFARELAHIDNNQILFAAKMDKNTLDLLPNNVKVASLVNDSTRIGLRKFGIIVNQLDNRRVIFDRAGMKTILEDIDLLDTDIVKAFSPHCVVIGRFPLFRNEYNERMAQKISDLSRCLSTIPSTVAIHHQVGLLDNVHGGVALVQHLLPHLDSIDLGIRELQQLYSLVVRGDLNTTEYSSDIETSLSVLKDLWSILTSGSPSSRPGTRKLSRVHLQGHDYHILMVAKQAPLFHMNLRHSLAKGLMARLHSRCGRKYSVLRDKIHFHLDDDFFLARNLTSAPITCLSSSPLYDVCVSPVPTCLDLTFPLDDGQSAAAASLSVQIKMIH